MTSADYFESNISDNETPFKLQYLQSEIPIQLAQRINPSHDELYEYSIIAQAVPEDDIKVDISDLFPVEYDVPPLNMHTKHTFDLGRKDFTLTYVKLKVSVTIEIYGWVQKKNQPSANLGSNDTELFSSLLKREIMDKLTVLDGIKPGSQSNLKLISTLFKYISVSYPPDFKWFIFHNFSMNAPLSTLSQLGDYLIFGASKLIVNFTFGPNLKMKKGTVWPTEISESDFIPSFAPNDPLNLRGVVSKIAEAGVEVVTEFIEGPISIVIGVAKILKFYVESIVFLGESYIKGNQINMAKRFSDGFSAYLYAKTVPNVETFDYLKDFNLGGVRGVRKIEEFKSADNEETLRLISTWANDIKLLNSSIKKAVGMAGTLDQGTAEWDYLGKRVKAYGAAFALRMIRQFWSFLRDFYGDTEAKEIWRLFIKGNNVIDEERKGKGFITRKIYDSFISDFLIDAIEKRKPTFKPSPLNLYGVIKAKSMSL